MTENIGIFGGAFNPPHLGHVSIAEKAEKQFAFDRLVWIPTAQPPHKTSRALAAAEDRLAMVRALTVGHPKWEVSDAEISRGGVSYTFETLREFRRAEPRAKLFLIIGSDQLNQFGHWKNPAEISREATLVVYPRPGSPVPRSTAALSHQIGAPLSYLVVRGQETTCSSSAIRKSVSRGIDVSGLVPPAVLAYIQAHGLYREDLG
ncbi:MAG: nicotinate (nicotinamide) nucleotide adenylyltransferase [Verrucomicrobiae bacterium]|nr:nicotinate (nicotinamide) nucleotide adenylyltransferase [Verrucomicrobiae bacterium]